MWFPRIVRNLTGTSGETQVLIAAGDIAGCDTGWDEQSVQQKVNNLRLLHLTV